jgi:hypothetical protein
VKAITSASGAPAVSAQSLILRHIMKRLAKLRACIKDFVEMKCVEGHGLTTVQTRESFRHNLEGHPNCTINNHRFVCCAIDDVFSNSELDSL